MLVRGTQSNRATEGADALLTDSSQPFAIDNGTVIPKSIRHKYGRIRKGKKTRILEKA